MEILWSSYGIPMEQHRTTWLAGGLQVACTTLSGPLPSPPIAVASANPQACPGILTMQSGVSAKVPLLSQ